jgi:hypothetical protein
MSAKCDKYGHTWSVEQEDAFKQLEICQECGLKQVIAKELSNDKEYIVDHKQDFLQPGMDGFAECYPDAVERLKKEDSDKSQDEAEDLENKEKMKWEIKRIDKSSKFVH